MLVGEDRRGDGGGEELRHQRGPAHARSGVEDVGWVGAGGQPHPGPRGGHVLLRGSGRLLRREHPARGRRTLSHQPAHGAVLMPDVMHRSLDRVGVEERSVVGVVDVLAQEVRLHRGFQRVLPPVLPVRRIQAERGVRLLLVAESRAEHRRVRRFGLRER